MHPRCRMLVAKNIAALPGSARFSNALNQHLYMQKAKQVRHPDWAICYQGWAQCSIRCLRYMTNDFSRRNLADTQPFSQTIIEPRYHLYHKKWKFIGFFYQPDPRSVIELWEVGCSLQKISQLCPVQQDFQMLLINTFICRRRSR